MADVPANVPLVDLQAQYQALRENIDDRVKHVLSAAQYILGPEVQELERELAAFAGSRHVVSCANGTDALKLPLLAAGIGPGDAVFVPSFTFVATAEVVLSAGATPVFVDIDEQTYTMDAKHLAACIEQTISDGRLVPRAIIPVDLFGVPAPYDDLHPVARKHELLVIADSAQALGAELNGRRVGSLTDVTATSFYPSKPLGCYGDGGAMFTDDDELASNLRIIRAHGFNPADGQATHIGVNSRLDTVQAAVLLAKLEAFESELVARDVVAGWYSERLADVATLADYPEGFKTAWGVYAIQIAHDERTASEDNRRDRLRADLTANNIASAVYYGTPIHLYPAYSAYGGGVGSLPVTEKLSREMIALPISAYITEETVAWVCDIIRRSVT